MSSSRSTIWCFVLLCMVLAAAASESSHGRHLLGKKTPPKKKPTKKPTKGLWPPKLTTVKTMQDSDFICDGTLRYLPLPSAPYPANDNKDSPYNLPAGITCSRPRGGSSSDGFGDNCGAQAKIDCLPFTGIGPINQAPVGTPDLLALPPGNGLKFTISADSKVLFRYINWTVWDVGTGGAKFEALFSGGGSDVQTHEWTPNGPQADGNSECGACTNCEIGKGIKSFTATAKDGQGINGWILSQKYNDVRCGLSCFDLDASYWTGVEYICQAPTCGDTNPLDTDVTPFSCSPDYNYVLNPANVDSTVVTPESCCLPKTCGQPDPVNAPGVPIDCSQFNDVDPDVPQTCTAIPGSQMTLVGPFPQGACCDCVINGQSGGDIGVTKVVSPGKKKKKTKKTTKKKKKSTKNTAASAEPVEGIDYITQEVTAAAAAAGGPKKNVVKIKSGESMPQPVGSVYTFDLEVTNTGLEDATGVTLKDVMPSGLSVDSVTVNPFSDSCSNNGNEITCKWDTVAVDEVITVTVEATGILAGTWENCARVSSESTDSNPDNNQDCATAIIQGACCTKVGTTYQCDDKLQGDCPRISGQQQFYAEQACMDGPCKVTVVGACCLTALGRCIDNLDSAACSSNAGQFFQGQTCAQITASGQCGASKTGACCIKSKGQCYDDQQELICATAGGDFYSGKNCRQIACGDSKTGACCNSKTGACQEDVTKSACPSSSNTWLEGGSCSTDGFCTGACCGEDGECAETLKADCSNPKWKLYTQCDDKTCPSECVDEWKPCDPNNPDACCDGLTCEYTYPGCQVGSYVCKARPNNQCVGVNQPCGGSSSCSCCPGLMCQWNHMAHMGLCVPYDGCAGHGDSCGSDYDCCSGARCFGGISKHITWGMCNKPCNSYGCFAQRQMNCACFFASAASGK